MTTEKEKKPVYCKVIAYSNNTFENVWSYDKDPEIGSICFYYLTTRFSNNF